MRSDSAGASARGSSHIFGQAATARLSRHLTVAGLTLFSKRHSTASRAPTSASDRRYPVRPDKDLERTRRQLRSVERQIRPLDLGAQGPGQARRGGAGRSERRPPAAEPPCSGPPPLCVHLPNPVEALPWKPRERQFLLGAKRSFGEPRASFGTA